MSEKFIPNNERDASIPIDILETIDAVYSEPDNNKRLNMLDAVLEFSRGLQKNYPREAIKQSGLFYKLSGGSIEDIPFNESVVESVREIDLAITTFVRGELRDSLNN